MALLLQRVCWNSNCWQGPTGEMYKKEKSYVGENGMGHEEWNFNASDLLDGKVHGYSYYSPPDGSPLWDSKHDIFFFSINPRRVRLLVGSYRKAKFLNENEWASLKKKFARSDLLQKRVDELLSLDLPTFPSQADAKKLLLDHFAANIEVDPENVNLISPARPLTKSDAGGRDPKHLSRYTTPIFLQNFPKVRKRSRSSPSPSFGVGIDEELLEDAYVRFTKNQRKVISRVHNKLSNRFRSWLTKVGVTDVLVEANAVDVRCTYKNEQYLFELKVCFQQKARQALREALGQLLEYRYYPNRPSADHLAIVIDTQPSEDDIHWFHILNKRAVEVELYWLKGDIVFSPRLTDQPLALEARIGYMRG